MKEIILPLFILLLISTFLFSQKTGLYKLTAENNWGNDKYESSYFTPILDNDKSQSLFMEGLIFNLSLNYCHTKTTYRSYQGRMTGISVNYFSRFGLGLYSKIGHMPKLKPTSGFDKNPESGIFVDIGIAYRISKLPFYIKGGFTSFGMNEYDLWRGRNGYHLGLGVMFPLIEDWFGIQAEVNRKWTSDSVHNLANIFEVGGGFVVKFIRKKKK